MPRFSIIDTLRTHRTEPGTSNRAACLQTMLFSFMFTRAERKRGSDNFTVRKVARWERERTIETNQVRLNETVEERFTCAFSRVHAFTPAYIRIYIYVYICEYSRCTKEKQKGGWRKGAPTPCVEPYGRGNEMADGGRNTTSRCENRGS